VGDHASGFESMLGADRGGLVVLSWYDRPELVKQVRETGVARKGLSDHHLGTSGRYRVRTDADEEPDRALSLTVVLGTRFAKYLDRG
jgi:hypothetical protein